MQAFLPEWTYPCGQWDLWTDLGAIEFRRVLYEPSNISSFRSEFFSYPLWERKFEPVALVKAMVRRTAASCVVAVPQSIVEAAFHSLDLGEDPEDSAVEDAESWLIEHEDLLAAMMRKHSRVKVMAGPTSTWTVPIIS